MITLISLGVAVLVGGIVLIIVLSGDDDEQSGDA